MSREHPFGKSENSISKEEEINLLAKKINSDMNRLNALRAELGLEPTTDDIPSLENSKKDISTDITKNDLKDVMISPDITGERKEILEKYKATQKVIDDFHQFCSRLPEKETPDFWDRMTLSVESISQLTIPLLEVWGKQIWFAEKGDTIINDLKSDLIKTYMTRYFLREAAKSNTLDNFKNALDKKIPEKIEEINNFVGGSKTEIDINKIDIAGFKEELIKIFEKVDKFEKNKEFFDKMWNNFVKDFLEKAPNIKSEEDKTWFFEQLFNIAYHAADYVDFSKNNKNMIYCYNYQFLQNNFDSSKDNHYDFQMNHIDKSTTYSNLVYKWADELGIKKLKVLIGKYLIKP